MSDLGLPGDDFGGDAFDWEGSADLTSVSEEELESILASLVEEEQAISYRRRLLQGRIDLIRAELVRRGGITLSPEDLARVLLDRGLAPGEDVR
jgi:hypothetical protein